MINLKFDTCSCPSLILLWFMMFSFSKSSFCWRSNSSLPFKIIKKTGHVYSTIYCLKAKKKCKRKTERASVAHSGGKQSVFTSH